MASVVPRDRSAAARAGKPQNLTRAVLREPGDRQFASTLERGLRVLQCFSADSPELGNAEIAARTGLPKPTVSRLTHTLVRLGYLRRHPDSGDFGLGMSILCLGYPLLAGLQLRRLAAGPMKELADLIDGSVAIGVRDHLRIVALENITTRDVLKRKPGTGLTLPLVSSTAGTAWLVGATADERKRAIREIEYAEPGSWARQADEFGAFRTEFARLGYVKRRNVLRPDTVALGVPLRRRPGAELLVLSCVLATSAATADVLEQRAAVGLLTAAKYIGEKLQQP